MTCLPTPMSTPMSSSFRSPFRPPFSPLPTGGPLPKRRAANDQRPYHFDSQQGNSQQGILTPIPEQEEDTGYEESAIGTAGVLNGERMQEEDEEEQQQDDQDEAHGVLDSTAIHSIRPTSW